jgi:transient receptor potential cation channel subfamily M protein 2
VDAVVTRWKRSPFGTIVQREGKNVLEYISVLRPTDKIWSIPGVCCNEGNAFIFSSLLLP